MRLRFFNTFETVSPVYRQLLPHLAAAGHEVEAVIADRRYRPGGLETGESSFRVREVPTLAVGGLRSRASKLALYATYALSAAAVSLLGRRVDVNVFLTQPPLFSSWGRLLRTLRGQRYLQIVMDLYPWVAIEAGVLARGGLPARATEAIARSTLRRAERVVVIGRCMAERVTALGVSPERIVLIRNWADTDVVQPVPPAENRLRREHGLQRRFVVMYSGNLGLSHRFDDLLAVAERLQGRPEAVFLVVGGGSRLPEVRAAVEARCLDNVRFLGYQRYEDLALSLSMGDVHFVSLRDGFEGLVVPSKAYGVLAAGRPLIYQGSPRGEIARLIAEEGVGTVVDEGDAAGLEKAVLRGMEQSDWRRRAGERARRLAVAQYGPSRGLADYTACFRELG